MGRLTLNPLKHIDPFWTVALPVLLYFTTKGHFVMGMAKPVPVNFERLHSPRRDTVLVALAGPFANILLAFLLGQVWVRNPQDLILLSAYLNVGLAVFNLIPIPPLDGSRVLAGFLPRSLARLYLKVERWGFIIVVLLYWSGILYYVLVPGMQAVCSLIHVPPVPWEYLK